MAPDIPPELTDRIIDALQDDYLALDACSLVCRAWLPRSRSHKFHTIEVAGAGQLEHLSDLLLSSPDIGPYIREITLALFTGADAEQFFAVIPTVTYVETLALHLDMDWHEHPVFPVIPSVITFSICAIDTFSDYSEAATFLRAFPSAQDVRLERLGIYGGDATPLVKLLGEMPLQSLILEEDIQTLTPCISLYPIPRLRSLLLQAWIVDDLQAVRSFIETSSRSSTLEELTLKLDEDIARGGFIGLREHANALGKCPSLKKLAIIFTLNVVDGMADMISNISNAAIQLLHITVKVEGPAWYSKLAGALKLLIRALEHYIGRSINKISLCIKMQTTIRPALTLSLLQELSDSFTEASKMMEIELCGLGFTNGNDQQRMSYTPLLAELNHRVMPVRAQ